MAVFNQTIVYGIYFAVAADGIAAQALNGGQLAVLNTTPDAALATFTGGVIAQVSAGMPFTSVPGVLDLAPFGVFVPTGGGPSGATYTPRYVATTASSTVVTQKVYNGSTLVATNTVTYTWEGSIIYTPLTLGGAATGYYAQQIVRYTGDGSSNRAIATTLDLTLGRVVVWICGTGHDDLSCMRHNGSSMLGTCQMGNTGVDTTHGIMSFTASGFTVTLGTSGGINFANGNGTKYTAIVMRDTTSDNRYLQIGTYIGIGSGGLVLGVQAGSPAVTGAGFHSGYNGIVMADISQGTGNYTFVYTGSATNALISPAFAGTTGAINVTFNADDRPITVAGTTQVTHTWIWGRSVAYRSTDFTGDSSITLAVEADPNTNIIQSQGVGTFQVGTDVNVNSNASTYHYVAFCADAAFLAMKLFGSWKATGDASPPKVVSGIGFTPAIAFGRKYGIGAIGCLWKGLDHVGTDSNYAGSGGGFSDDAAQGVTAMGSGTVSNGTDISQNGIDFYGWAFVAETVQPVYPIVAVDVNGDLDGPLAVTTPTITAVEGAGLPINAGPSWALQRLDIKASTQEHQ